MSHPSLRTVCCAAAGLMLAAGYPSAGLTHSAGATLDANGTTLSATGLAAIACFDDGSGEPHQLFAQIRDLSEPVDGLLLNVQLLKGNKATNSTDPISGDGEYSPGVVLEGGPGIYYIMVNKTGPGPRAFDVVWHCETADNFHTGTSITVLQFQ